MREEAAAPEEVRLQLPGVQAGEAEPGRAGEAGQEAHLEAAQTLHLAKTTSPQLPRPLGGQRRGVRQDAQVEAVVGSETLGAAEQYVMGGDGRL